MTDLKWTHDLPAEEGWYFFRIKKIGIEDAYFISKGKNGKLYKGSSRGSKGSLLRTLDHRFASECEWAGPLPQPKEQSHA